MFTDLFGKTYDRNPNIVDVELDSAKIFSIISKLQRALDNKVFTESVELYLVKPIIQKLENTKSATVELLKSELSFLKTYIDSSL